MSSKLDNLLNVLNKKKEEDTLKKKRESNKLHMRKVRAKQKEELIKKTKKEINKEKEELKKEDPRYLIDQQIEQLNNGTIDNVEIKTANGLRKLTNPKTQLHLFRYESYRYMENIKRVYRNKKKLLEYRSEKYIEGVMRNISEGTNNFLIVLTKDKVRSNTLLKTTDRDEAITYFKEYINNNKKKTHIPSDYHFYPNSKDKFKQEELEILLLSDSDIHSMSHLYDEELKEFINAIVTNDDRKVILNKSKIYTETLFYIYGTDPNERLYNYEEIKHKLIFNRVNGQYYDSVKIVTFGNKIIFQTLETYDIVVAPNVECVELFCKKLMKDFNNNHSIHYLGEYKGNKQHIINQIKDVTGWTKPYITNTTLSY